jgi:hypothetical protein
LEQVQTEYSNQLSGATADESMVDMGRGDNPRFVLSVAARRLGNRNMFNASIINLESGAQLVGRSVNYDTLNDGIEAMENLARELTGVPVSSLNISGLEGIRDQASKSQPPKGTEKPKKGAGGRIFGYGVLNIALGLGSFIQGDWSGGLTCLLGYGAAAGLIGWELTLSYDDELAGIPGTVGLGVAGVTVLYGFIRPVVYNKNHRLAVITDRVTIELTSGRQHETAVRLSYTLHF